jgi:hypothetical protein
MCCQGNQLPSFGMDNSISALWTDLISVDGKNPYYKSYILDGQNVFTVGWYNTLEFYDTNALNTFEITLFEGSNNILFNYGDVNVFGHTFTVGLQGTEGQFEQIYTGTNSNQFDNTAYLFTYTPPEPEEPIAPDCSTNPAYINCIIQSATDTPVFVADNNTTEEPSTETTIVDNQPTVIGGEALSLEELLAIADSTTTEETQEEKEKELADNIAANILEQVLSTNTTETEQRRDRDNNSTTTEEETIVQTTVDNAVTENVETVVEETSLVVDNTTTETQNTVENVENVVVAETTEETKTEETTEDTELLAQTVSETIEETSSTETSIEENEMPIVVQQQQTTVEETTVIESNTEEVTELQVVETSINQSIEIADQQTNEILVATTQTVESDTEIIEQQVLASISQSNEKIFDEEDTDYGNSFISIAGTNTVLNTIDLFQNNNMADKEAAGAFGKQEDKSDAEKRAEEIVAANAKEQEEINNNYMDADQSGLIGAIAGDTDVTAYRTSNIPDLSSWYKPEDIYKNVKYNDNKRGMYFLEKGNTDTYKKMVEEQYK